MQRTGPPDDDHADGRAAWCGADAVHRHDADDPDVATILTTAHDIHRITVAFSAGRTAAVHSTAAAAPANLAVLHQNALVTAAHADPSRPGPILGEPRRQPAGVAVGP